MCASISRRIKDTVKLGLQKSEINGLRKIKKREINSNERQSILQTVELTTEQKNEIDELFLENYGEKIEYEFHRYYMAFTGHFDSSYFPEMLYNPSFELYMNLNKKYDPAFSDKNVLPMIAANAGIKMPETVLSCVYGMYKDGNGKVCDKAQAAKVIYDEPDLFAKPSVDSYGGVGCCALIMQNGIDTISGESAEHIIDSYRDNFVIQKKIKCHEAIRTIYPDSVNTFRIITYRWKDDIFFMPVVMRIGSGGKVVDNVSSGGMFIGVDMDGQLHDTAFTEAFDKYKEHPDTKVKFAGCKIPNFEKMLSSAKTMHTFMPQMGCVNWDFTLNENGEAVLIEANIMGGSIDMLQISHGTGPFGERTAEVLRWIRQMKNIGVDEQKKFLFGKMENDFSEG